MPENIFVLGLLDWQKEELNSIDHAQEYNFHALLSYETLVQDRTSFERLLSEARGAINDSGVTPDAIICHWDFPSSCLAPVLSAEYGLRAPTLRAVLKCEHKYWARLEQQKVVPEVIPRFQALDPFKQGAEKQLDLPYPMWLKPVKGYASMLGFMCETEGDVRNALEEMRRHIEELGQPFDECLAHVGETDAFGDVGGQHALAESIMRGRQFAPEGYVLDGQMHIHGFFDMMLSEGGKNVKGLRYPAQLPNELMQRAHDVCEKVLKQVGFDNGCFNVEFLWDESEQKLWLIEVNTRISQSHSELFRMVTGMSNHEVAVSVALGQTPHLPPSGGRYAAAAKYVIGKKDDATVIGVPDEVELADLSKELGDALIEVDVKPGQKLSDIPGQPPYAYTVAEAWVGGQTPAEIDERYRHLLCNLPLEFSDGKGLLP